MSLAAELGTAAAQASLEKEAAGVVSPILRGLGWALKGLGTHVTPGLERGVGWLGRKSLGLGGRAATSTPARLLGRAAGAAGLGLGAWDLGTTGYEHLFNPAHAQERDDATRWAAKRTGNWSPFLQQALRPVTAARTLFGHDPGLYQPTTPGTDWENTTTGDGWQYGRKKLPDTSQMSNREAYRREFLTQAQLKAQRLRDRIDQGLAQNRADTLAGREPGFGKREGWGSWLGFGSTPQEQLDTANLAQQAAYHDLVADLQPAGRSIGKAPQDLVAGQLGQQAAAWPNGPMVAPTLGAPLSSSDQDHEFNEMALSRSWNHGRSNN